MIISIVIFLKYAKISNEYIKEQQKISAGMFEEEFKMKKRMLALAAVVAACGIMAVGCASKPKETEAPATEVATTEAAAETEAATTEAAAETEAATTEAAAETEAATTEAATTEAAE
jgi:hypothetical protein